jgi:hypothetical protein
MVDTPATLVAKWLLSFSLPDTWALIICVNASFVVKDAIMNFLAWFEHWRNYFIHVFPFESVAIPIGTGYVNKISDKKRSAAHGNTSFSR